MQTIALALNASGDAVPDWIQLTPAGPDIEGRDGRKWVLPNPEEVVAAFKRNAADLPVDFEHATQVKGPKGEAAPAIGWIKDLEVRSGAIWGRVEWNEVGRQAIASKGYRYISPVFTFKKAAGDILKMLSAGLTNQPNLQLAALNTEGDQEEPAMNKAILEALGLSEGASETDALTAINKLKSDEATARNRAENPDASKFVPRADHDLALNRIKKFEDAEVEREDEAINTAVDAAIEAGKIAPASRDYHVAACRDEGGLERFQKMVEASPEIAAKSDLDGKKVEAQNKTALTDEELATCRALGMTEEDFAAAKADENKE
ncbi:MULTISPECIES: phage protease [unclassified Roseobacter]|uniref:phage protease n=1 Tax=unclassified Roseobacter TaxID=196798 RepID=UPI001C0F141A